MQQIKIVLVLAAIVALLITIGYACQQSYQAGVNAEKARQDDAFKERYAKLNADFIDQIEAAQHESNHWRQVAVALQNSAPIPATKVITKIVRENATCSSIHGLASLYERSRDRFKPASTSTAEGNTGD